MGVAPLYIALQALMKNGILFGKIANILCFIPRLEHPISKEDILKLESHFPGSKIGFVMYLEFFYTMFKSILAMLMSNKA